jgi:DNA-binding transcriptional MerR regulator
MEERMSLIRTDTELEGKMYRPISEVSEMVGVKPHVLRYWETQFSMLRPKKNRAGNRMYRPEEIRMLLRIKELLYSRRFTIAGAKRRLLDERKDTPQMDMHLIPSDQTIVIHEVKEELQRIAARLRAAR